MWESEMNSLRSSFLHQLFQCSASHLLGQQLKARANKHLSNRHEHWQHNRRQLTRWPLLITAGRERREVHRVKEGRNRWTGVVQVGFVCTEEKVRVKQRSWSRSYNNLWDTSDVPSLISHMTYFTAFVKKAANLITDYNDTRACPHFER